MRQKIKVLMSFLAMLVFVFGLASCVVSKPTITVDSEVEVAVGETKNVTVLVEPADKLDLLTVEVVDPTIASAVLNEELLAIKGLKEGTTKITLKVEKTKKEITVTVIDGYQEKTILELLESGKNNDKARVAGTVFEVTSNGFYLEDNTGKIYVTLLEDETVELGDKLILEAEYGLISNYPRLKAAKIVSSDGKATSYGEDVIVKSIAEIKAFNRENLIGTYANLFEITGTITKDAGNILKVVDEEGNFLLFNELSNFEVLNAAEGKRYKLTVILHDFNIPQQSWRVTFTGTEEDLILSPLTLEDLIPLVEGQVNNALPSEVYGLLNLPLEHPNIPSIGYQWSVDSNEFITIENNKAVIDVDKFKLEDATEQVITLTLTISTGEQEETLSFDVKLMPIVERTVSALLENVPEVAHSYVIVRGTVLAFGRNQSLSIRSYIIEDSETKEIMTVDFSNTGSYILNTSDKFKSVQVGDEIVVHGQYRNYTRETLERVSDFEIVSSNNPVVYDYESAYVLNDEASYNEFGLNYEQYINKLVKIENPYFNYSTSSTPQQTNWVIINHSEEGSQVYDKAINKKRFAFLIEAQSENLNNYTWMEMFNISYHGDDAIFNETVIYAYALYVSDTYLAFVIPSINAIEMTLADKVEAILLGLLPRNAEPNTIITFPQLEEHLENGIIWTSDHEAINVETGFVSDVLEETIVTLTAAFIDGTDEFELSFEITVLPAKTYNVSEIFAVAQDGYNLKVEGQVVGYFSDGNANGVRGLVVKDLVTSDIVFVNDSGDKLGSYANYLDKEGKLIEIGDVVYVEGTFSITSTPPIRNEFLVNEETVIEILEKKQEINFPEDEMVVISNQDEMVAFFENPQIGKVIKFVGTEDNPFGFGGSTSSNPMPTMNHKFFYNKTAAHNDNVKYPNTSGKVVTFKNEHNIPNGGEHWWTDLFDLPDYPFVGPTATQEPFLRTGVLYGVLAAETGTYFQMDLLNVENISVISVERKVEIILERELSLSVEAGGEIFLPTLEDIIDGGITWTSEDPLINVETGEVGTTKESVIVALTATFAGGTLIYDITILPSNKVYTVKEAVDNLASGIEIRIKGVIAGFHWNGSGTLGANTHGIILKDSTKGNEILYVTGLHGKYSDDKTKFVYTLDNDHVLAKGDEIELTATFKINDTIVGFEGRKELVIDTKENADIVVLGSDVVYEFDLEEAIVVENKEDFTNVAKTLPYGTLIKMQGALNFRSSVSSYGSGINFVPAFTPEGTIEIADYNHSVEFEERPQRFSFKFDGNAPNLGESWWEDLLGLNSSNFEGTDLSKHAYEGFIYFYLGSALPKASSANGYIQLVILEPSWVSVERK